MEEVNYFLSHCLLSADSEESKKPTEEPQSSRTSTDESATLSNKESPYMPGDNRPIPGHLSHDEALPVDDDIQLSARDGLSQEHSEYKLKSLSTSGKTLNPRKPQTDVHSLLGIAIF
jgi:hypothetical protein